MSVKSIKKSAKEVIAKNRIQNANTVLIAMVAVFVLNLLKMVCSNSLLALNYLDLTSSGYWYIDAAYDYLVAVLLLVCYFVLLAKNLKASKSIDYKVSIINIFALSAPYAVMMVLYELANSGNWGYYAQKASVIFYVLAILVSICFGFVVNALFAGETKVFEAAKKSTYVTVKNLFKIVLFELSFVLWILIPAIVLAVWQIFYPDIIGFGIYNLLFPVLSFSYFGIALYYFPYYIVAKQLFYNELVKK